MKPIKGSLQQGVASVRLDARKKLLMMKRQYGRLFGMASGRCGDPLQKYPNMAHPIGERTVLATVHKALGEIDPRAFYR